MGTLETMIQRRLNQQRIAMKDCYIKKTITCEEFEEFRKKLQLEIDNIEWILNEGNINKYVSKDIWSK